MILGGRFAAIGASEGTIWMLDEEAFSLVPIWNSGPDAKKFVARYRQPLVDGLVSLVCVTGQPLCENKVYQHASQDPRLDRKLGLLTCSMIAVPFDVAEETCGVVSCVKLKKAYSVDPDPSPFTAADLSEMVETVRNWQNLTEDWS